MKALYKYPQGEFPYRKLEEENGLRTVYDREYELLDTGKLNMPYSNAARYNADLNRNAMASKCLSTVYSLL